MVKIQLLLIGLILLLSGCTNGWCTWRPCPEDIPFLFEEENQSEESNITLDWFPKNHTCFSEGSTKTYCDKITFENGSELLINCLGWSGGYTIRCINTTDAKVERGVLI